MKKSKTDESEHKQTAKSVNDNTKKDTSKEKISEKEISDYSALLQMIFFQ